MIHTLMYAKKLIAIGIPREQAEAQIEIMAEIVEDHLVTKEDFKDLKNEMIQMEYRLTIKFGSIVTLGVGILAALITLK
ncbi:MAG: hypothetical protein AAB250_14710 [Bdellovibrionota bacterium]